MTIRVFKSTDAGAPVLTGLEGSLIAVLTACLVTGYGSYAAAGWSKPYESGNVAVYTPGAGSEFFLQIDDSLARSGYGGRVATARIFESMTSATAGVDGTDARFFFKSSSASSAARGWMVVADEQAAYLLMNGGGAVDYSIGNYQSLYFFGRFVPVNTSDAWAVGIVGGTFDSTSSSSGSYINSISGDYTKFSRNYAGSVKNVSGFIAYGVGSSIFCVAGKVQMAGLDDWTIYSVPAHVDNTATSVPRAWLPGFYGSVANDTSHDTYASSGLIIDGPNGTNSLLCLRYRYGFSPTLCFIDLVSWGRS